MFEQLELHESKAGSHFIRENRTVDDGTHHSSKERILIESSKELIVEMRMIGFRLVFHHIGADLEEFFFAARLVSDVEVNKLFEFIWHSEINGFVFSFKGGFEEVDHLLHGFVDIGSVEGWMGGVGFDFSLKIPEIEKFLHGKDLNI